MIQPHLRGGDFNGLAATYERYGVGYSSELFAVLEGCGFKCGARVVDVGCGTGISLQPLAQRGMTLTGVDPSAAMLAIAKNAVPAATFVSGGAEQLPFTNSSFDGAVSAQAFHWFDADRAFAELIRVVVPGGPVAIWWKILGAAEPMRELRAAACTRAGVEPSPDALRGGFGAFYRAPFAQRLLRVLPFTARFTVDDWIGYERSRAAVRNHYGAKSEVYFDALRLALLDRYGSPSASMSIQYSQFLYVGTTARS
jgi:ubiquinone/menaquinone biosynthesis C-methylase UbiE